MIKKLRISLLCLMLPAVFILSPAAIRAQSDPTGATPVTRTYAITNATVVPSPGKVLTNATVLFSNGLITAVGNDVKLPENTEIIDGTDLFVYPGFIDGMSYTGAVRPKAPERPNNLFAPDPPNNFAGITPENSVINQIITDDNNIKSMRDIGFTISHTVPYGRMLPGSGALLTLIDTDNSYNLLIKPDASMYTQFVGAPGAYPSNTLGIMAKWRNLYRNAEILKNHTELYASNAAGLPRPIHDGAVEAFFPVISKDKPVFYNASSVLDARRALRLQNELGFSLVLGNLKEGWDLIEPIKNSGTKVFLSLDVPKKPEPIKGNERTEETEHLEKRRMEFWEKYVTLPQTLDNAGIKYGFSTMGINSSKVKENLRLLIDNGLTEDAALAALTINAAQLLNIDRIAGTLEAGKLANAVITTAPVFEKEAFIKYMFVDGNKFVYEKTQAVAAKSENVEAITGTWTYTIVSPEGEQTGTMVLKETNGSLTGTMSGMQGMPDAIMNNLVFMNGLLSFDFTIDGGGQSIEISVSGTVTGNEYDAEATIAALGMNFPIRAVKDGGN